MKFSNSYVRICQGLRTSLKPNGIVLYAPEDVILGKVENRDIRTTDKIIFLKETTSHYHMQLACVRAVCQNFHIPIFLVLVDVKEKFTEKHKKYVMFFTWFGRITFDLMHGVKYLSLNTKIGTKEIRVVSA